MKKFGRVKNLLILLAGLVLQADTKMFNPNACRKTKVSLLQSKMIPELLRNFFESPIQLDILIH